MKTKVKAVLFAHKTKRAHLTKEEHIKQRKNRANKIYQSMVVKSKAKKRIPKYNTLTDIPFKHITDVVAWGKSGPIKRKV